MFTDILLKTARVQRAHTGSLYQLHTQRRTTATLQTKDVCQINECSFTPRGKKKTLDVMYEYVMFVLQWEILMGRHRSYHRSHRVRCEQICFLFLDTACWLNKFTLNVCTLHVNLSFAHGANAFGSIISCLYHIKTTLFLLSNFSCGCSKKQTNL